MKLTVMEICFRCNKAEATVNNNRSCKPCQDEYVKERDEQLEAVGNMAKEFVDKIREKFTYHDRITVVSYMMEYLMELEVEDSFKEGRKRK